jgi:type I restriction enzyme, S subunit
VNELLKFKSPLGTLPEDWSILQLKDITTKIGSGATPKGGQSVYLSYRHQFALIRSQNVFDRFFDRKGLTFITDEHAAQLQGASVQPGDLLLNITGDGITFARATKVPIDILPACVNQHVAIIRPNYQKCCSGYLLAYLTHPLIKEYMESFNAGGSRRAITKGHIESFSVLLPPLPEQQDIAHILGSLDDKIELNRQMNETLEGIARALFQSWFVDFDPVRAKMAGRQPYGMDAETAALFPDGFEDSVLGEIPRGWKSGDIEDIADNPRLSVQPEEIASDTLWWYQKSRQFEGKNKTKLNCSKNARL